VITSQQEEMRDVDIARLLLRERTLHFLVELNQAMQPLTDPAELMACAARSLGEQMGVDRCAYAEVEADEDTFVITGDYVRDTFSIVGRFRMSDFGAVVLRLMRANEPYVVDDVETDGQAGADLTLYHQTAIRSVICVPLHKQGRFAAAMAVHQKVPRRWTSGEVELVQLVASRCWESLERARVVRSLRQSEQRLRFAQRAGRVGVFEWLIPEGQTIWSPELERLYGVPEGTFEGTFEGWRRRVVPEDAQRIQTELEECLRLRLTDYDYEFRAVLPDGTHRWLAGQSQFVYDEDGQPLRMIGVNVDIAERRRIAEERERLLETERQARAEAERVNRLKDEFLATLSHELRTPLNAILGWAQILQRKERREQVLEQGLTVIERNARLQTRLIEDLLDMSRIISGKVRLDVQGVDLAAVAETAVGAVQPSADAKGIRLEKVIDPSAGPVSGDPGRLQQVLWNLLSNAIKFTPRGGRVQIVLRRVGSHLEVSVCDTGIGIPRDFLPHVFERFRQADASSTRMHGGLGLGLSIVKQLVELHGGSVRAESEGEGQGATLTVALPLALVKHDLRQEAPMADLELPSLTGIAVLVVDDEPDARDLLLRTLADSEADVVTASSAAEGVEAVRRQRPDVLLSDIGMPEADGYEFIRQVRALGEEYRRIPAVALTAFARSEDRRRSMLAGFQMHLSKPVEPAELVAVVASLAGRTAGPWR
jgi:signal transduction histidine kinase/CheY-like chemotaxis protein